MTETRAARPWRALGWALRALAAAAGLLLGYDFGARTGGVGLGALMALNAAAFFWLMASALIDALLRLLRPRAARQDAQSGPA
jgi:hypothetical protein